MKTIMKLTYAAFAVVALALGSVTASDASADARTVRPTPTPRPRPPGPPSLVASINGSGGNLGGFIYEYPRYGVQNTFASSLSRPRGVAFDSAGNLFVATSFGGGNTFEGSVVKITPNGVQNTFVVILGNYFLSGVAIDQSNNVFVMAMDVPGPGVTIFKVTPGGLQSTFASLPSVASFGLVFDGAGFLYAAQNFDDATASEILKFAPDGTSSLFATASSPDFDFSDFAFDRFGNLFVSVGNGLGHCLILKYTPNGTESTFATDLNSVRGLAFDNAGNLFLADVLGGNILKFTSGATMTVFASGIAGPEFLAFQRGLTP